MPLEFADPAATAIPLDLVTKEASAAHLEALPAAQAAWARAQGFRGGLGEALCLPATDGSVDRVLVGWGDATARARGRFHLAGAAAKLPEGVYALATPLAPEAAAEAALGWLLSGHRFTRYKAGARTPPRLVAPEGVDAPGLEAIAAGVALTRDFIDTPARDMGPSALEAAFLALAERFGAETRVTRDKALEDGFPMIHAVGHAAEDPPRLLDMVWGREGAPEVTLVGKGVCFDTGGLDLKPASAMGLMKKDMGGAANVMGLAQMIMARGLDIRLRVLVPAVENAVSAGAFRPGDVLTSRKGLTVEVNNTDAEGRLVLADALALADEGRPGLIVSMATLTGAARVALGPDLPAMFTDDEALAAGIAEAGARVADPVWRLPLWPGYEEMIEPDIADLDNAPSGGFAGAITAALFLRRFVEAAPFVHFDIYGWTPKARPARPRGGEAQAIRALLGLFEDRFGG